MRIHLYTGVFTGCDGRRFLSGRVAVEHAPILTSRGFEKINKSEKRIVFSDTEFVPFRSNDAPNSIREPAQTLLSN